MDQDTRKRVTELAQLISGFAAEIDQIHTDEQERLDGMSETRRASPIGAWLKNVVVVALEQAADALHNASDFLTHAAKRAEED